MSKSPSQYRKAGIYSPIDSHNGYGYGYGYGNVSSTTNLQRLDQIWHQVVVFLLFHKWRIIILALASTLLPQFFTSLRTPLYVSHATVQLIPTQGTSTFISKQDGLTEIADQRAFVDVLVRSSKIFGEALLTSGYSVEAKLLHAPTAPHAINTLLSWLLDDNASPSNNTSNNAFGQSAPTLPPKFGLLYTGPSNLELGAFRFKPGVQQLIDTQYLAQLTYLGDNRYRLTPVAISSENEDSIRTISQPIIAQVGQLVSTSLGSFTVENIHAWPGTTWQLKLFTIKQLTEKYKSSFSIEKARARGSTTFIIELSFSAHAPELANSLMHSVLNHYNDYRVGITREGFRLTIGFLQDELIKLNENLNYAEKEHNDFLRLNQNVTLSENEAGIAKKWAQLESLRYDLEFSQRLLSYRLNKDHPEIQNLQKELEAVNESMRSLDQEFQALPEQSRTITRLQQQVELNDELHYQITSDLLNQRLHSSGVVDGIQIIDEPVAKQSFRVVQRLVLAALAIFLTFLCALSWAIVTAFTKRRVTSLTDLQLLDLNVTATIPTLPLADNNDNASLASIKNMHSTAIGTDQDVSQTYAKEAIRRIFTNLSSPADQQANVITVLGATPNVGKSYFSLTLASFAAKLGKTLIIDCDLRQGVLQNWLVEGIEATVNQEKEEEEKANHTQQTTVGLTEVLSGQCSIESCIKPTPFTNLDCIGKGQPNADASWIINTTSMEQALSSVKDRYDFIIIDTGPILLVAESMVCATVANHTFLVCRHDYTRMEEVTECLTRLKEHSVHTVKGIYNMLPLNKEFTNFARHVYEIVA